MAHRRPSAPNRAVAIAVAAAVMTCAAAPWPASRAVAQTPTPTPQPPAAAAETAGSAQTKPDPLAIRRPDQIPAFDRVAFHDAVADIALRYRGGDHAGAEAAVVRLLARYPGLYNLHYTLAQLQAQDGRDDDAVASLTKAAKLGLRTPEHVQTNPVFAAIRGSAGFVLAVQLMQTKAPPEAGEPPPPTPAVAADGRVVIDEKNVAWDDVEGALRAVVALPPPWRMSKVVSEGVGDLSKQLNQRFATGAAAGNIGDFYENRDRGHSRLRHTLFPQLTYVAFSKRARDAGLDYGLKRPMLYRAGADDPPVFGNSSTAIVSGVNARSLPRLAMVSPQRMAELWQQYSRNQLFIYPEHQDHDPLFGDLYPANIPYLLISQGSSGSDRRALTAVAAILASFKPEVKSFLARKKLIAPTVQLVWRWGQKGVSSIDDYLSGAAHPSVFVPENAGVQKMSLRANAMPIDAIPPIARLRVLQESVATPGIKSFSGALGEGLFDTPAAISRIHRTTDFTRRMVVTAADTRDPNDRPLSFKWVLLRGDPERVRITPVGENGAQAAIDIDWHDETHAPGRPEIRSQRVDIGVFAYNGRMHSAPSFISVAFPPRQKRVYFDDGRIRSIDYDAEDRQQNKADPSIYPRRLWRDAYDYDGEGRQIGWTRTRDKGPAERFTRHGARVVETDDLGRAVRAEHVDYVARGDRKGHVVIDVRPRGTFLDYEYDGPDDLLGVATPERAAAPAATK